jgi:2-phospho-L-lactate guanylyltransferase
VTVALIPVKELSQAKARLSPVLDAAGRRALALAMFGDVLRAALACDALDGVAVVSRDEEVLAAARGAGAEGMAEPGGLNEALDSAAKALAGRGVERVVIIAADLPLAMSDSIASALATGAAVAIAESRAGGTNILAMPPGAFSLQFGPDSARRHTRAAKEAGLSICRLDAPELALDIDTPGDLSRLRAMSVRPGQAHHTEAALRNLRLTTVADR